MGFKTKVYMTLAILLTVSLSSCEGNQDSNKEENKDPIIAKVVAVEIKESFIDKSYEVWMYNNKDNFAKQEMSDSYYGEEQESAIKTNLLNIKIKALALENYYKKKNQTISEKELQAKYDELIAIYKEEKPEYIEFYESKGIDDKFIKDSLKSNYYIYKFMNDIDAEFRPKHSITESEYKNFKINVNPRVILVKDKEMADEIYQKIKDGEDFAELVEKYSTDESSKQRGGELGIIKFEDMPIEFSIPVFKLKKGEVTEPFKTVFGYNIVELIDYNTVSDMLEDEDLTDYEEATIKDTIYNRALSIKINEEENKVLSETEIEILVDYLGENK